jgi:hypothetical protein
MNAHEKPLQIKGGKPTAVGLANNFTMLGNLHIPGDLQVFPDWGLQICSLQICISRFVEVLQSKL